MYDNERRENHFAYKRRKDREAWLKQDTNAISILKFLFYWPVQAPPVPGSPFASKVSSYLAIVGPVFSCTFVNGSPLFPDLTQLIGLPNSTQASFIHTEAPITVSTFSPFQQTRAAGGSSRVLGELRDMIFEYF